VRLECSIERNALSAQNERVQILFVFGLDVDPGTFSATDASSKMLRSGIGDLVGVKHTTITFRYMTV
jgi:hypothetical protein